MQEVPSIDPSQVYTGVKRSRSPAANPDEEARKKRIIYSPPVGASFSRLLSDDGRDDSPRELQEAEPFNEGYADPIETVERLSSQSIVTLRQKKDDKSRRKSTLEGRGKFRDLLLHQVLRMLSKNSDRWSRSEKEKEAKKNFLAAMKGIQEAEKGQQIITFYLEEGSGKVEEFNILRSILFDVESIGNIFGFDADGRLAAALELCLFEKLDGLSDEQIESVMTLMCGTEIKKFGFDWRKVGLGTFGGTLAEMIPLYLDGDEDEVERLIAFLKKNQWVLECLLNVNAVPFLFETISIPVKYYPIEDLDAALGNERLEGEVTEIDEEKERVPEDYRSLVEGGVEKLCLRFLNHFKRLPLNEDQFGVYSVERKGRVEEIRLISGKLSVDFIRQQGVDDESEEEEVMMKDEEEEED